MTGLPDPDVLMAELTASGLFDAAWYLRRNGDVAAARADPLSHFVHYGWAAGRSPNRFFDPVWHRRINTDVAAHQLDPLLHYLRDGAREGRHPHPLFDPGWYRDTYGVPGAATVPGHYLANRITAGVVPSPGLFAARLLPPYSNDPAAGIDPVAHYLDDCEALAHEPFPDPDVVRAANLLDENYYLINGADVHEAHLDPTEHFCRYGWHEHRKPNIYFDPAWYEATNPDLLHLTVNPLVHYALLGEPAGRRPVPFFDPAWYRSEYAVPDNQLALGHHLANRRKQIFSPTPLFDIAWYMARFGDDLGPNRDPFMHFPQAGMRGDIDASRGFDAAHYRRTHLGRPSRRFWRVLKPDQHHPLVHYPRAEYAARNTGT